MVSVDVGFELWYLGHRKDGVPPFRLLGPRGGHYIPSKLLRTACEWRYLYASLEEYLSEEDKLQLHDDSVTLEIVKTMYAKVKDKWEATCVGSKRVAELKVETVAKKMKKMGKREFWKGKKSKKSKKKGKGVSWKERKKKKLRNLKK